MVRRSTRWKKPPPKELSTPSSRVVIECYGFEGAAYVFRPMLGEVTLLFVISPTREVREVFSLGSYDSPIATDAVPKDWRVLGWLPPNGERHGPHDRVDPEMADLDKLPLVNHAASFPNNQPFSKP